MSIEEKQLWKIYHIGLDLRKKYYETKAENKLTTISYKLLNSLKIGNINQFMDILMRTYMAQNMEIPSIFIKSLSNLDDFYAIGYSFLNGLLGKEQ